MPWQQQVADVILEVDPATGRLVYSEWGLTVPRQSGKSTFVEAKSVHRCSATKFFGSRQRVVYTAQTRQKAREKWEEDFVADIEASAAFRRRIRVHKGNGNEHIRFQNGSRFGLEASTEKAGHGGTLDETYIDEAFAQVDHRLEQAFGPAMITRLNKQLGWISTAGWKDGSPYLTAKVELGRLIVAEGRTSGVAYFEWSAPEDADPGDEDVWWLCMPALGHTVPIDAIRAEYQKAVDGGTLNEFCRAYLNQWKPKRSAAVRFISEQHWGNCKDPGSQIDGRLALGIEMAPDLASAAISVGGRRADGRGHGEVLEHRPGTAWFVGRTAELVNKWKPAAVVLNPSSVTGSVEKELAERGIKTKPGPGEYLLHIVGAREYAQACVALKKDIDDEVWRHLGQGPLDDAAAGAGTRKLAESWAWDHFTSTEDICPLVSVTLARQGFMTHGLTAPPKPFALWGK